MVNSIVPQNQLQPRDLTPNTVSTATMISKIAWDSHAFGSASEAQAAMIMLKAYELGFPMTSANEFLEVIDNRAQLKPLGAMALMRAHPEIIRSVLVEDLYDTGHKYIGCRCTIERIEGDRTTKYIKEFTLEDAKTAKLVKPDSNWEKYPKQMCQWRAGFCADIACPDLLAGMTGLMKRGELMNDPDDFTFEQPEVTVIDSHVSEPKPEADDIPISDLMSMYGPEKILEANNGMMPNTAAERAAVHAKLQNQ